MSKISTILNNKSFKSINHFLRKTKKIANQNKYIVRQNNYILYISSI